MRSAQRALGIRALTPGKLLGLALPVVMAVACSSGPGSHFVDEPAAPSRTTTPPTATARTRADVTGPPGLPQAGGNDVVTTTRWIAPHSAGRELEEYLARRYEAYWDAFDAARGAPTVDPSTDFPLLDDLAAGEQLEVSYRSVIDLAEKGEAIREPGTPAIDGIDADSEHRVRVDSVDGAVAELSGCVVNDDVRHEVASGTVIRDDVATVLSTSTMVLTGGDWKLIRSRALDISAGVTGCWLSDDSEFPY